MVAITPKTLRLRRIKKHCNSRKFALRKFATSLVLPQNRWWPSNPKILIAKLAAEKTCRNLVAKLAAKLCRNLSESVGTCAYSVVLVLS